MEPVAVGRPSDALELIERGEHFDVAALDMLMPEMDGFELARRIRRHPDGQELPLVLLTSLAGLPQARSAEEFSAQLAKPVKASQLYNALLTATRGVRRRPRRSKPPATTAHPRRRRCGSFWRRTTP